MTFLFQPFKVSLLDSQSRLWALTRTAEGRPGVWLSKPLDLSATTNFHSRASTTQVGETITGWSVDKMSGELDFMVTSTKGTSMWTVWQMFLGGLTRGECTLIAASDNVGVAETKIRVKSVSPPEKSPATDGISMVGFSVSVEAHQGCWVSQRKMVGSGTRVLKNRGDFPLWPRIVWRGAGASVTLPDRTTVKLPTVTGESEIDTDPAFASRIVTKATGVVDHKAWRAMRGQIFTQPVLPGEATTWTFTNCECFAVEKYVTAWGSGL